MHMQFLKDVEYETIISVCSLDRWGQSCSVELTMSAESDIMLNESVQNDVQ
jgi:hypothetical protein